MAGHRDDSEVQIDNSTKVHLRNAPQQLIMIAALNVGTLLYVSVVVIWCSDLNAGYRLHENLRTSQAARRLPTAA
jgi:hypothetical protein